MNSMTTWLGRIIRGLFVLLLLFFSAVTYPYWSVVFYSSHSEFTEEHWKQAHQYKRLEMARDLLSKTNVENLNRDQVIDLLGEPDMTQADRVVYLLSITTADFMALSFVFDDQARVVKAYIHQT